jgi:predicted dinucleotide-binding enzyme
VYAQIVNSSPDFGGAPASVLLASDDADAKEVVAGLARDAGYDPWDAGPLWSAYNIEKVAAVMVTIAYVVGAGTDQAIRIVQR